MPLPRKIVNQKQYSILGGISEIGSTNEDLKNAEMMIPTTSPLTLPIWTAQKTDGPWRMTVDYYKPNSHYNCYIECVIIAWANLHIPWDLVCSYWSGKCFFCSSVSIGPPETTCFPLARPAIHFHCPISEVCRFFHLMSYFIFQETWSLSLL